MVKAFELLFYFYLFIRYVSQFNRHVTGVSSDQASPNKQNIKVSHHNYNLQTASNFCYIYQTPYEGHEMVLPCRFATVIVSYLVGFCPLTVTPDLKKSVTQKQHASSKSQKAQHTVSHG